MKEMTIPGPSSISNELWKIEPANWFATAPTVTKIPVPRVLASPYAIKSQTDNERFN